MNKFILKNAPNDGITAVNFDQTGDKILVSSWDKTLRLYSVSENTILQKVNTKASILDSQFCDSAKCVSGGLEKKVLLTDLETGQSMDVGSHEAPVKCIKVDQNHSVVYSGSWDETLKVWDIRSGNSEVKTHTLFGKVRAMAFSRQFLIVSTSKRVNYIFDMREATQPFEKRDSPLKKPICSIGVNPDGRTIAYGSTEGRVAIENIDSIYKNQNYAFKCHRSVEKETKTTYLYPVTAIAYHPKHFTFATGGCDGVVNFWDGYNKKRIAQLPKYEDSISSLAFDAKGEKLAVAISYMWQEGERESEGKDMVEIRDVRVKEVRRKADK